eukprot:c23823_g2_i1 orf=644-1027(+)
MEISGAALVHTSTVAGGLGYEGKAFSRPTGLAPSFATFEGLKGGKSSCIQSVESRRPSQLCNLQSVKAVAAPVKPPTSVPVKRSKVEIFKEQSNYLRYPLKEELETEAPNINEAAVQLIKFHGSYQQ